MTKHDLKDLAARSAAYWGAEPPASLVAEIRALGAADRERIEWYCRGYAAAQGRDLLASAQAEYRHVGTAPTCPAPTQAEFDPAAPLTPREQLQSGVGMLCALALAGYVASALIGHQSAAVIVGFGVVLCTLVLYRAVSR